MTHELSERNSSRSSPSQSPRKRLGTWAWYGALAGLVFSSPGLDLTFDNVDPVVWFGGTLSMVVLFGLPAGFILGWLDSRRGSKRGWQAMVKVPAIIIGGSLLLFGIFAIPITIDVLSRWGSEAIAGAVGNSVLRRVIGTLAGACLGLTVSPLLLMSKQINDWAYAKLPMATEGQAEQMKEQMKD